MINKLVGIRFYACLLIAAIWQPFLAYGQVDDAAPRLGDLVGGSASRYCALGETHDIENAVDVFGRQLAFQLIIPRQIDIPGQESASMEGVSSVRLGAAEVSVYKDLDMSDALIWVRVNGKLGFHRALKDTLAGNAVRCTVGRRNLAFVSTLDQNGNVSDLYVFDDAGRLITTIKGKVRFNVPLVMVDELGMFSIFGTGLSINGTPTWPNAFSCQD